MKRIMMILTAVLAMAVLPPQAAAGDFEEGLRYAKETAEQAKTVHAYDEAITAYGQALDCAEALGLKEQQAALEESLGLAYNVFGKDLSSAEHYERALAFHDDPRERCRIKSLAAASYVTTGDPRGLEHVKDIMETELEYLEERHKLGSGIFIDRPLPAFQRSFSVGAARPEVSGS